MTKKVRTTPEFSRPLPIDRVPRKGSHEFVEADTEERERLAKRFSIPALHSFSARLFIVPWRGGGVKVTGQVEADLDQVSVVSVETFRQRENFEVLRFFIPEGTPDDAGEDDADPITNGEIDMGEIAAETLGLELDPYPRKPGEVFDTDVPKN